MIQRHQIIFGYEKFKLQNVWLQNECYELLVTKYSLQNVRLQNKCYELLVTKCSL